jgi:hypothetical protein
MVRSERAGSCRPEFEQFGRESSSGASRLAFLLITNTSSDTDQSVLVVLREMSHVAARPAG